MDQTYASFAQQPPPNGKPDDPARMVGTGAVGVPPVVKAQIRERELLLLCSDGVHKFVSDEQIAELVSRRPAASGSSLRAICDALVHAAKKQRQPRRRERAAGAAPARGSRRCARSAQRSARAWRNW